MKEKSAAAAEKRPNIFVRMYKGFIKGCKEIISELKKVTWPKGAEVAKKTGVVLVVVVAFLIVIGAFDLLLSFLLRLLTGSGS